MIIMNFKTSSNSIILKIILFIYQCLFWGFDSTYKLLMTVVMFCEAITEEEFYSLQQCVSSSKPSTESSTTDGNLQPSASSTPSPQSLIPSVTYAEPDPNYNPHKKLTHVSSLSAPEVNQVTLRFAFAFKFVEKGYRHRYLVEIRTI